MGFLWLSSVLSARLAKKSFVLDDGVTATYNHEVGVCGLVFIFPCILVTSYGVEVSLFWSDESGGCPCCEQHEVVRLRKYVSGVIVRFGNIVGVGDV